MSGSVVRPGGLHQLRRRLAKAIRLTAVGGPWSAPDLTLLAALQLGGCSVVFGWYIRCCGAVILGE